MVFGFCESVHVLDLLLKLFCKNVKLCLCFRLQTLHTNTALALEPSQIRKDNVWSLPELVTVTFACVGQTAGMNGERVL